MMKGDESTGAERGSFGKAEKEGEGMGEERREKS